MSSRRSLWNGLDVDGSGGGPGTDPAPKKPLVSRNSIVFEGIGSCSDVINADPFVSLYSSAASSSPPASLSFPSTAAAARVPPPSSKRLSRGDWAHPGTFMATARRRSSALLANAIAEARLDSLDAWDYTIELECLQGPDGQYRREGTRKLHHELHTHRACLENSRWFFKVPSQHLLDFESLQKTRSLRTFTLELRAAEAANKQ